MLATVQPETGRVWPAWHRAGQRLRDGLTLLAALPTTHLMLVMLLLNTALLPCQWRYHDAILYELQVTNRAEGGRFADDLFLRFGSQDSYALFSRIVAPLASLAGAPLTFLILYLASKAVFFLSLIRLVRRLVPDAVAGTVGLLAVAVSGLALGGLHCFQVNESFFTPRLLAIALSLLGLERGLAGKPALALVLITASLLMHPLMGFGGFLTFAVYQLIRSGNPRLIGGVGALTVAAALTVLLTRAAVRLFGHLDPDWREVALRLTPYLFGTEWTMQDWATVVVSLGILILARCQLCQDRAANGFLLAVAVTTLLSIVGTLLASQLPYALLVQGQPFRSLWLTRLLEWPLAWLIARRWWASGRTVPQVGAVLLPGYLAGLPCDSKHLIALAILTATFVAFLHLFHQRRGASPLALSLAAAILVVPGLQAMGYWIGLVRGREMLAEHYAVNDYLHYFPHALAPGGRLLVGLALIALLVRLAGLAVLRPVCLALSLVLASVSGWLPNLLRPNLYSASHRSGIALLRQALAERVEANGTLANVFWPIDRPEYLWFDLGARSYFSTSQLAGSVFSRATALEGRRRGDLVARFEIAYLREIQGQTHRRALRHLEQFFGVDLDAAPPTLDDLCRLCADPDLDYIVTREAFAGWYLARDGKWFLYDCRAVRRRSSSLEGVSACASR